MRSALIIVVILFFSIHSFAQHSFEGIIKNSETGELLPGAIASIKILGIGASANANGIVRLEGIPSGEQSIEFSFLGYKSKTITVVFPVEHSSPYEVLLEEEGEELEEIVITSTRSSRTIADIPTRVEFIAGEELDEKANMKPGDIRMLLNESTGIQTQQTSATSANSSIRIQGLDGRYTQILKDGFPLYAGFSGGLGLLQTPPLDLKQVEVIKGSSSTLFGGGAIAGMVNLISRVPAEKRDLRFFINGTSAKGLDLSGFYGKKLGKIGITVFGSRNSGEPYDPADIDLTAIPEFERYSIHPKVFVEFDDRTTLNVGLNFTTEDRIGGDIKFIEGHGDATHQYFEQNGSRRLSSQVAFSRKLNEKSSLNVKGSINRFDRVIETPGYKFDGVQNSSFAELSYNNDGAKSEWIAGLNLWTDDFSENQTTATPARDYTQNTFGAFLQNTVSFSDKVSLESGLRGDYVVDYGFAFLPRVSLLYKISRSFSSRIGGGFGYKAPTIFTEEAERRQYRDVLPVSVDRNDLERSYGANWDLNYRTELGEIGFSVNHLFFYTYLNNPLFLSLADNGNYAFVNLQGYTDSKGTETNVKFEWGDFKLFIGYTFTDTKIHDAGTSLQNPLTAKHRLNNVLMYEVEEKWKAGLEAYYFSKQRLTDNAFGKEYWICGFMIERLWERFSLFVNFENFLDARQTRFDTIYTGSV
ncbi:MAG TPA: TonB-dependent receptor, partial [Chryseosolibacter sp.]|nr:TonB-dependent receptor [Chryseosolibacter sp.]